MRNMSFMLTTRAYELGSKTHTRRLGWRFLKIDEQVMGCEQCQGLRRGEKIRRLHPFLTLSNDPEPLMDIVRRPVRESGIPEVVLEGFPEMAGHEELFVKMFAEHNHCDPEESVQRIGMKHIFEYPAMPRVVS